MKYQLRDIQQDIVNLISDSYREGNRKILVILPTGAGKTILSYVLIANALQKGNRVLFTTHRIALNNQTVDKLSDLNPTILQGSSDYDETNLLTVATIQTLANRNIPEPKIVILDEVHYGFSSVLIQSIFERFPNALFIGLSATPVNERGYLLENFDSHISKYQTIDLIEKGWLTPFVCYSPVKLDLYSVRIKGNDYDESELSVKVSEDYIINEVVRNYQKYGENRKFICFCVNKDHANRLKNAFNSASILTDVIVADTPAKERERLLDEHKAGKIKGLLSVEILTTGYDDGSVSAVLLACPTKSWRKYIQCCGRGIRLNGRTMEESIANGKKDCILLDCAGAIEEHDLPTKRKVFKFEKKISRVIDRELKIDEDNEERKVLETKISTERMVYLKRIGSLLDLYEGKQYSKESELQEDVNRFLEKTDYFWFRQNSGKLFVDGRWVNFTSKSGLPDNTVYYKDTSFYFGLELKMKHGKLTEHQKQTLPEMTEAKILFFIVESVMDVYEAIKHVEGNIEEVENGILIKHSIYQLSERQVVLRKKLKLPEYK